MDNNIQKLIDDIKKCNLSDTDKQLLLEKLENENPYKDLNAIFKAITFILINLIASFLVYFNVFKLVDLGVFGFIGVNILHFK